MLSSMALSACKDRSEELLPHGCPSVTQTYRDRRQGGCGGRGGQVHSRRQHVQCVMLCGSAGMPAGIGRAGAGCGTGTHSAACASAFLLTAEIDM